MRSAVAAVMEDLTRSEELPKCRGKVNDDNLKELLMRSSSAHSEEEQFSQLRKEDTYC